jgi:NADH-quinone oxidoreductase subunit N
LAVEGGSASAALVGGFLLGTVGLLFKAGVFPFHLWVPDVYDGSPTWVTSLMASAVKVFAFAALARFVFALGADLDELLAVLSVATMSLGNILAFRQTDVKRMLAYSSVAHAGFLLLILLMQNGLWPTLFYYAMAYSLASLTAFSVLIFAPNIDGLSRRQGLLAGSFAVALISLSGLPPTAGFFAKFILLAGMFDGGHWILAILALANALLSLGYYFRLLPRLFAQTKSEPIEVPFAAKLAFSILTVATVLGGVFFGWVLILAGS